MGGYDIFKEAKVRRFVSRNPASAWRPLLLKRLYPYLADLQRQSPAFLRRFFDIESADLTSPYFSHLPRWKAAATLQAFLSPEARAEMATCRPLSDLAGLLPTSFGAWDPFNRAEYLEAAYLLPGFILSAQGDRVAMAHSVEVRHPFLDYRVVEFAARLPRTLKMKVLDEKHLLKNVARGLVPESIRTRPKQPYRAPDGKAFFGPAAPYMEALLCPEKIAGYGLFDPKLVAALAAKFRNQRPTSTRENMAMVAILSTALLIDLFISGHHRYEPHYHASRCGDGHCGSDGLIGNRSAW
jgi:asparagine synthase (glutamine-hydrolysing)